MRLVRRFCVQAAVSSSVTRLPSAVFHPQNGHHAGNFTAKWSAEFAIATDRARVACFMRDVLHAAEHFNAPGNENVSGMFTDV